MPLTDPVPSSSFDVLERNIQDTDKFVNQETGTFTNRVGKVIKPIPVIEAEALEISKSLGWAPVGEFATGFTYTKLNDVGRDASGSWWRYNGSDLPKAISAGTVPSSPNFSVISFETADNVEWKSGKSVGYSLDDLQGFTDELYAQAEIVDSGIPDSLGNSQRVTAIKNIIQKYSRVVPLSEFSSLVVGDDWTAALQAALDTGLPVLPDPSVTYNISGIVQSNGNKVVGEFNVNPTRAAITHLGTFTFSAEKDNGFSSNLKMVYCLRTYDLIEMMYIRSMGFNAVSHSGDLYTDRPSLTPEQLITELLKMLDNCHAANLRVNMTTGAVLADDAVAIQYVNAFHSHPAVWGFSVFDEPSLSSVTVARQNERLTALRAITDKNLNAVDVIQNYSAYKNGYNPWSTNYDIMFVDAYCHTIVGTLQDNIDKDLSDMRTAVGVASAYFPASKIIPTCGIFKHSGFTTIFEQIKETSGKLVRSAGGDFALWAWDKVVEPGIVDSISTASDLRNLARSYCEIVMNGERIPTAHIIGGTSFNPTSTPPKTSINGVSLVQKQADVTQFVGANAAMGVIRNGSSAEFTDPSVTGQLAGLLFKNQFPAAILDINVLPFITLDFELLDVTGSQSGTMIFTYTEDDGATLEPDALSFPFTFTPIASSFGRILHIKAGEENRGGKFVINFGINPPAATSYRLLFHGFIIMSEW